MAGHPVAGIRMSAFGGKADSAWATAWGPLRPVSASADATATAACEGQAAQRTRPGRSVSGCSLTRSTRVPNPVISCIPLHPRKRTYAGRPRHVRFVPEADIGVMAKSLAANATRW